MVALSGFRVASSSSIQMAYRNMLPLLSKSHTFCFATCLLALIAHVESLSAEPLLLPAEAYGRVNIPAHQGLTEAVDENPNFEPVYDYPPGDRIRDLSSPVGRLDILTSEGSTFCTAVLIDEDHLLTNNHCIPGKGDVQEASIIMGYYDQTNSQEVQRYEVNVQPIESSVELDYSILEVFDDPDARWSIVELENRDPGPGESLLVIHHPNAQPLQVTRRRCQAAPEGKLTSDSTVFHRCDTLRGSSGSPVLSDRNGGMLALHHAGLSGGQFNQAIRLVEIVQTSAFLQAVLGLTPDEPLPSSPAPANVCAFVNDGECDEPIFCAPGTDVMDCSNPDSHFQNSCTYAHDGECDVPSFCDPGTDTADCGMALSANNSCDYANDGECDEPGLCEPGTDAADCEVGSIPDNSCQYANDGECDVPAYCAPGTDFADCGF